MSRAETLRRAGFNTVWVTWGATASSILGGGFAYPLINGAVAALFLLLACWFERKDDGNLRNAGPALNECSGPHKSREEA